MLPTFSPKMLLKDSYRLHLTPVVTKMFLSQLCVITLCLHQLHVTVRANIAWLETWHCKKLFKITQGQNQQIYSNYVKYDLIYINLPQITCHNNANSLFLSSALATFAKWFIPQTKLKTREINFCYFTFILKVV